MTDKAWLESLKVGDEVCYKSRWHGCVITRIEKITPTKQIKTENGYTFKNGYCRLDSWDGYRLEKITDEVRNSILKSELIGRLSKTEWKKISLSKLQQLNQLLKDIDPTE